MAASAVESPRTRLSVVPVVTKSNSPAKRWSKRLIDDGGGWIPVARAFLRAYNQLRPAISPQEALFLLHLIDFKRDERPPYPSYKRIAGFMGVTDKMVRNYARHLEDNGYIKRQRRLAKSNAFDLEPLFRKLEELLDAAVAPVTTS